MVSLFASQLTTPLFSNNLQMVSTGIPEIQASEDVNHLRESLKLGASDAEADGHFETLIAESLQPAPRFAPIYIDPYLLPRSNDPFYQQKFDYSR